MKYEAMVIGCSAGGMDALKTIFAALPASFRIPTLVVLHLSPRSDGQWVRLMNDKSPLLLKEADEKEPVKPGHVYFAPPNYHLLVEPDRTLSLTIDERVNFARPSIDVLFESAADVYKDRLIGIVLTGGNHDGAQGLKRIQESGGLTIVEDPKTAVASQMPSSAIATLKPDHILPLQKIIELLNQLQNQN